ncbi:MAG: PorT family protein [Barnesiella sp.]|nr:PorT family protein [Barnesiella sp.]MBD5255026.1 PorT family protein [Barnesiella sp.]
MKKTKEIILAILALVAMIPAAAGAQQLNDKLLNRPYADLRRWHLGFSIGVHTQDMRFTHNGFVTDTGEQWFMDQPSFSPGFCVNGLVDFRLNEYFSLRLSPGLYFGNREIKMVEPVMGLSEKQNLRSVFVVAPIDVKYSAQRYRNLRPYLTAGVMPALDVSKKRSDFLKLKSTDVYLTVGLGCDFYLPFFKLNPEIKFCFGLTDVIQHDRPDLVDDPERLKITQSLKKATSQMVVLTFYFE